MQKKSKILIIGFGSIGERHYKNLKKLGYRNISVFDIDKSKIANNKLSPFGGSPEGRQIPNLKIQNLIDFDIVFVCSPNHLHIKHALKAAEAGCHLFIEKPLSHNLQDLNKLRKLIKQKKLVNMVACNMRFHPALRFIKDYIDRKKLGKIYNIYNEFGYFLPYWRKGTDYRKNYAAKKSTGGGIILDDIHEFDLLFWLNDFAPVLKSMVLSDKVSDLEIQTEDVAIGAFRFKNSVLGMVKSDYLNKVYTRRCEVVGEKGSLKWSWDENKVRLLRPSGEKEVYRAGRYDLNQMYIDEVKYFLDCVSKRKNTFNEVSRAGSLLKYLL